MLALPARTAVLPPVPRGLLLLPFIAAGLLIVLMFAIGHLLVAEPPLARPAIDKAVKPLTVAALTPQAIMPLSTATAQDINRARPIDGLPNPAALGFIAPAGSAGSARALECLTAAVYYEAASESEDGQRAVAQVVLNRVRHPAYPHSVCGVVYQGSALRTGCQFSFTCDGSLARTPSPAGWTRARKVALAALGGSVYAPVGLSTHYHADYVVPYWQSSLTKTATVGAHIFYRLPHARSVLAFSAAYRGEEPVVRSEAASLAVRSAGEFEPPPMPDAPIAREDEAYRFDSYGLLDFRAGGRSAAGPVAIAPQASNATAGEAAIDETIASAIAGSAAVQ